MGVVGGSALECRHLPRPEASDPPAAGVKSGCELPDRGAGNRTQVLSKHRMRLSTEPSFWPQKDVNSTKS